MIGGSGGWLGLDVGEETGGGEVAGDEVADMTVDIVDAGRMEEGLGQVACEVAEAIAPVEQQCFEGVAVGDSRDPGRLFQL